MAERALRVVLVGDERDLERSFTRASRASRRLDSDFGRLSRGALVGSGALGRMGRAATFASGAFLGGVGITAALRATSEAASNLAEQTSKANVVFGRSSKTVQAFAKDSLALATDQALAAAAAFGALLRPLGITAGAAATTSTKLVQLAIDLSSFSNTPVPDALQAIQSGLVGEIEPLRRYGILLSEARVQQEALKETGKRHVQQLTNQEKVQARLTLIFRDSAQAQGDFARTSGGLANQQRILQRNIRDLEIAVGTALNPTILQATKRLNEWLGDSENQARVQRDITEAVRVGATVIRDFAAVAKGAADAVGGFKNLVELLLALKVASVLAGWAGAMRGFATATGEGGAAGAAGLLRTRLLALRAIGPIAIAVGLKFTADKAGINTDFSPGNLLGTLNPFANKGPGLNFLLGHGFVSDAERRRRSQELGTDIGFRGISTGQGFRDPRLLRAIGGTGAAATPTAAAQRRGISPQLRNTIFDQLIGRREDRVQDIRSLRGQAAELASIAQTIQAEIERVHDRTRKLTLGDDLVQVQRQRRDVLEQIAQQAKDAAEEAQRRTAELRQSRQFRALGLGPGGGDVIPGIANLRKRLGNFTDAVEGTFLDTRKTQTVINRIRRVLSGGLGAVSADVRTTIARMLDDLNQQLKDNQNRSTRFHVVNTDQVLAGLGLSPDQLRAARSRLARLGAGGTINQRGASAFGFALPPIVLHSLVEINDNVLGRSTVRYQQRRNRRFATQTTGPHAGNATGTVH